MKIKIIKRLIIAGAVIGFIAVLIWFMIGYASYNYMRGYQDGQMGIKINNRNHGKI